jgi:ribosomal protein S18 acetylase RimI-like enzyme
MNWQRGTNIDTGQKGRRCSQVLKKDLNMTVKLNGMHRGNGLRLVQLFLLVNTEMNTISITRASPADTKLIQILGRETFVETFAESNTAADMKKYLDESFSDEKVMTELSDPESSFFIAWEGGEPVAYMKLNTGKAQTEGQDETALEIERIYVKAAYHGKKVGQMLYEKALEIAINMKKGYIWLGVWENNPRAISFYRKNGFAEFGKHIFKLGDDEQTDVLMKKIIA